MNPAIIAAVIRAAGSQAAKKGAQRGAATAAGKVNWGAIASGVADALPTIMQGASAVRKWRSGRSGSQGEGGSGLADDDAKDEQMRKAFQEKFDRFEFTTDELATAPIHLLPSPLRPMAKKIQEERNRENVASEKASSPGPQIPVQVPQQSRAPRGWESMPKFLNPTDMPDPGGAEKRAGAPPIANEEQSKDRSIKQKLSDLVFAQTEKKRSQPEPANGGIGGRGGDGAASGGAGGNGPGNLPPGSNPPGSSGDDDEKEKAAKTFTDRLKESATAIGNFVGPIAKAYVAAAGFVKGLELLNTGVLALNRDLAQYNGNLAQAYAKADVDQMRRDVQRGDAMETPLSGLAQANSELRDTLGPPMNDLATIGAGVLTGMTKITNFALKWDPMFNLTSFAVSKMAEWVREILRIEEENADDKLGPMQNFFADVVDGKHDGFRPVFNGKVGQFPEKERKEIFGA